MMKPCVSSLPSGEAEVPQIMALQDQFNQLELRKRMRAVKAKTDALRARVQEEMSKDEKLVQECIQQATVENKDFPVMGEKMVEKETAAVGPDFVDAITPAIKTKIHSTLSDCFEREVNRLEKSITSKLEDIVSRQIQEQFQTWGKQVLEDTVKSSMQDLTVPAFEKSCKAMVEQVIQKGMVNHATATQQHVESVDSPLVNALMEAISSTLSITQTLRQLTGKLKCSKSPSQSTN